MGVVRCGMHGSRGGPKCCWRCDRCPKCDPKVGRLLRGDYCKDCTEKFKAEGYVFSTYYMNWIRPEDAQAAAAGAIHQRQLFEQAPEEQ